MKNMVEIAVMDNLDVKTPWEKQSYENRKKFIHYLSEAPELDHIFNNYEALWPITVLARKVLGSSISGQRKSNNRYQSQRRKSALSIGLIKKTDVGRPLISQGKEWTSKKMASQSPKCRSELRKWFVSKQTTAAQAKPSQVPDQDIASHFISAQML
ncbi:hypothetical protein HWV62_7408, partial [Athelia sp. TMB]